VAPVGALMTADECIAGMQKAGTAVKIYKPAR
jgi:hypothetical protein